MAIGVVTALPAEAATLTGGRLRVGQSVVLRSGLRVACAGTGTDAAARASTQLLREGVDGLVSWGCAGSLRPDVRGGELVVPRCVVAADGHQWSVHGPWRQLLMSCMHGDSVDILAESGHTVGDPAQRRRLAQETGAAAVDMESASILRQAAGAGTPAVIVRAVADGFTTRIPPAIHGSHGVRPWPLLWPWNWRSATAMAWGYWVSLRRLRAFGRQAVHWARVPLDVADV